jgi:phage tail-like protein
MPTARPALQHAFVVTVGDCKRLLGTFLDVTGIGVEYQTFDYEEGGNNQFVYKLRGRLRQQNLTLKSGLTDQTVLLDWVLGRGELAGPQDVQVTFTKPDGTSLRAFGFHAGVPVKWIGPTADIAANAVATESLEIAHRGLMDVKSR